MNDYYETALETDDDDDIYEPRPSEEPSPNTEDIGEKPKN